MTIRWNWYGLPNVPPTIVNWSPTGSEEVPTVDVEFSVRDARGNVLSNTIDLTIIRDPHGTPTTLYVIINGAFQSGYNGTITANAYNGYDVTVSTHPDFTDANYHVTAYAEDDEGESVTQNWEFTVQWNPKILSVVPSYLGLRIYFTKPMLNDDELCNHHNYATVPMESGAVTSEPHSVTPQEGVEYPNYVDLGCLDLTHGKDYRLTITPDVIQDEDGNLLGDDGNTADYHGVSERPEILFVRSLSEVEVEVVFSKIMSVTSDLLNPSRYLFTNGLSALSVEKIGPGIVVVRTSKQVPSELYELTVV